jgi:hypothetical protein
MAHKCNGLCDGIPIPSDQIGYKDPKYCYCGTCARPFYTDEKKCFCCKNQYRRKRRYNIEAPSKMKTSIILEIKN